MLHGVKVQVEDGLLRRNRSCRHIASGGIHKYVYPAIFPYNLLIVALQHVPVKHIGSKETRLASGQADFLNESFPFFGGAAKQHHLATLGREILYYRAPEHAAGPGHHQNPALYIKKILCHIIM